MTEEARDAGRSLGCCVEDRSGTHPLRVGAVRSRFGGGGFNEANAESSFQSGLISKALCTCFTWGGD